ncbi:MAG: DNA replication/repair protein RecF [Mogibacterium sp.]|nr:DNA replication/repair protein RecF [Mogibacterium sp.]
MENFRNYTNLEIDFDGSRNIIVGENAQGKTNLVEAIYMTAFARSFRTNNSADMIGFGKKTGRVSAYVESEEIEKNINITLRSDGKKMIQKDGKAVKRTADLLNTVVVIVFTPEDLRIIKDSPEKRRAFINRELSQMRPRYYEQLRRYNEALKEKNALLKGFFNIRKKTFTRADNLVLNDIQNYGGSAADGGLIGSGSGDGAVDGDKSLSANAGAQGGGSIGDGTRGSSTALRNPFDNSRRYNEDLLDIYDRQLADAGYELIRYRMEFVDMLSAEASEIMRNISGSREQLEITYKTACDFVTASEGREILFSQIKHNRDRDVYSGSATLGPHRDDIEFHINGNDAKRYGSQGQQRTIALSLKLAEIRIARQMLGEAPVLLLDDVLSELDPGRQRFLISEIDDVQLFITSAELASEVASSLRGGTLFRIEEGSVTRVDKY